MPNAQFNCESCTIALDECEVYRPIGHSQVLCSDCFYDSYILCEGCGCEMLAEDGVYHTNADGDHYCSSCWEDERRNNCCHSCESQLDRYASMRDPDGERVCRRCFDRYFQGCAGRNCTRVVRQDGSNFCRECRRRGEWDDHGFYVETPTFDDIRSERKFGVEIETSACPEHVEIQSDTVFGCKPDGSVDGMEFVSPVLYGDQGLEEVRKICGHARRLNWAIDSACGLHLHLDLSSEPQENCYKLAYAYMYTYDFWTTFVSNARKRNYYCAKHTYTAADITRCPDNFYEWCHLVSGGDRYNWVNWYAYTRHKTVEIRHHSATLNPTKLTNWIKAHARFIDGVMRTPKADVIRGLSGCSVFDQFMLISEWWDDSDLSSYYRGRAETFRKPIRKECLVTA